VVIRRKAIEDKAMANTASLDAQLDDFNEDVRKQALKGLVQTADAEPTMALKPIVNLHAHTFFSYNPHGYSPTHYAWLARKRGLSVAGIVDFDVLDGLEEFHSASEQLNLKAVASIESRVFVPEFSDRVINSPGEPGIAYHMGVGFTASRLQGWARAFLFDMRRRAERRNRELVARVNDYLQPVALDYDKDVVPLTPRGNATERHVCVAYVRKAKTCFPGEEALAAFWSDRLGASAETFDLPDGPELQLLLRAKTMKQGGVGYVQPGEGSFPLMADMDRFTLEAGAIPTLTWLDGTSSGEQSMEELMQTAISSGAAALNIIPDRNFTAGVKDEKLQNLYDVVVMAESLHLPIIVGTEMNSPNQKFVDDFDADELRPVVDAFLKGAYIVYAHSVLQSTAGLGYLSEWADKNFRDGEEKNDFYHAFGRAMSPVLRDRLATVDDSADRNELLSAAGV